MSVDETLTFDFRDEYNRKPIAKKIIRLLESDVDVSPMVIDGGWGTGKSEFCHKLINLIESEDDLILRSVYVDSFKADHADEPLMTLLAAVLKLLPEAEQKTLTEKALPAIRFGTKTVLKSAVSWVLKQEATDIADDFEGVLKDASDDAINYSIESILKDHVKADESIDTLRSALIELTKDKPIVIFVDELDRCRPDFAVSMLESIKHIFDVEGVKFCLVVNTEQLKASINHCYGQKVEAHKYLDKFIGYRFQIPVVIERNNQRTKLTSVNHFVNLVDNNDVNISNEAFSLVKELIKINNNSLREVETFVKYIGIYLTLGGNENLLTKNFGVNLLRIFGVYFACFGSQRNNNSTIETSDALALFGEKTSLPKIDTIQDGRYLSLLSAAIMFDDEEFVKGLQSEIKEEWTNTVSRYFSDNFSREYAKIPEIMRVIDIINLK